MSNHKKKTASEIQIGDKIRGFTVFSVLKTKDLFGEVVIELMARSAKGDDVSIVASPEATFTKDE